MNDFSDQGAQSSAPDVAAVEAALEKLHAAIAAGLPRSRCLRRWSEFIRLRDGYRCVDCWKTKNLSAHHIARKSFFERAQYYTGNGITLCRTCHGEAHRGFNGRASRRLPVDAQGGEKLPLMERFYSILLDDALDRELLHSDFYFLGDDVLGSFKQMQGYSPSTEFPGSPLEQAFLILAETELPLRKAIAEANGLTFGDQPLLPGGVVLYLDEPVEPTSPTIVRRYKPRSTK